jgi:hypothetical protein
MSEGQIIFDIHQASADHEPNQVSISTRLPQRLSDSFIGLDITDVLKRIPLLFNICGAAQGYCASQCAEEIINPLEPERLHRSRVRALIVLAEKAKETVFRLCMEIQALSGETKHLATFKPAGLWRKEMTTACFQAENPFDLFSKAKLDDEHCLQVIQEIEDFLSNEVFGQTYASWLDLNNLDEFNNWLLKHEGLAPQLINQLNIQNYNTIGQANFYPLIAQNLDDVSSSLLDETCAEEFVNKPIMSGLSFETGSLVTSQNHPLLQDMIKRVGHGVLVRYIARLIDLAKVPQHMRGLLENSQESTEVECSLFSQKKGSAVAGLDTARGRLHHAITLKGNMVTDYKILSPTQWNFHESSVAVACLRDLKINNRNNIQAGAECIIRAIDPCVNFEVRVH